MVCDPVRCNAVNSWRDEDQDLSKVLEGFQTFGPPQGCNHGDEQAPGGPLGSALQGLSFGLTCLAQLTAPQFARVQNDPPSVPPNGGRVILVTALNRCGMQKPKHPVCVSVKCCVVLCCVVLCCVVSFLQPW